MSELIQGIRCPYCWDHIWSKYQHDFHYCFCGYCFVDGGRAYLRWGYGGDDFPAPHPKPSEWQGTLEMVYIWKDGEEMTLCSYSDT